MCDLTNDEQVGDEFLAPLNISFDTRWRDAFILFSYVVFNVVVTISTSPFSFSFFLCHGSCSFLLPLSCFTILAVRKAVIREGSMCFFFFCFALLLFTLHKERFRHNPHHYLATPKHVSLHSYIPLLDPWNALLYYAHDRCNVVTVDILRIQIVSFPVCSPVRRQLLLYFCNV